MKFFIIASRLFFEIVRDRRTLAFLMLVPLLVMSLIYVTLVREESAELATVFRGTARLFSGDVVNALEQEENILLVNLDIPDRETDPRVIREAIGKAMESRQADGVLYFDEQLLTDRFDHKPGTLYLYLEGSRPTISAEVLNAVSSAMDDLAASLPVVIDAECSTDCANSVNNSPLELKKIYRYGSSEDRMIDFFLPVFPPFFVFFLTFVIATISFQRERVSGTLERLMIAPVRFWEIIAGYVAGFFLFALVQSLVVVGFILWLLETSFSAGQALSLLGIAVLTMLVALLMGLAASFMAANEFQAIQFIPLVILPQVFLSDMIWSMDKTFPALKFLSKFLPLTHANQAARDVMIRHLNLFETWPSLAGLTAFLPVVLALLWGIARRQRQRL